LPLSFFLLQAEVDTQRPGVLDLGTMTVLKELARAVTAVEAHAIPREGAQDVKADLVLLEALVAGVVLDLADLVVVIDAGKGVPVEDTGNADFEFLDDALAEHQGELHRPHVQVGRAFLDLVNIILGIDSQDDGVDVVVTQEHPGALHAVGAVMDADAQREVLAMQAVVVHAQDVEHTSLKTVVDGIPAVLHAHADIDAARLDGPVLGPLLIVLEGVGQLDVVVVIVIAGGNGGLLGGSCGSSAGSSVAGGGINGCHGKHGGNNECNLFHFFIKNINFVNFEGKSTCI